MIKGMDGRRCEKGLVLFRPSGYLTVSSLFSESAPEGFLSFSKASTHAAMPAAGRVDISSPFENEE